MLFIPGRRYAVRNLGLGLTTGMTAVASSLATCSPPRHWKVWARNLPWRARPASTLIGAGGHGDGGYR